MAITVQTPTHIGPGYLCFFSGATGPVPLDDFFSIGVRETGGSNFLTGGVTLMKGFTSGQVILGITDSIAIADGLDRYIAPGATVNAEWTQFHANFTVVASGTVTGLLWDPTGGVGALVTQLGQTSGSGAIGQILAAVRKTYT